MTKLYELISGQYEADTGGTAVTLTGLEAFINPRFIFKGSSDCCTFYLDDKTVYDEIADFSEGVVERTAAFFYKGSCGLVCICPNTPIDENGRLEFSNKYGDGTYVVLVNISYSYYTEWEGGGEPPEDWEPELIVVSDQFEYDLTIDCCKELRENIICTVQSKMNSIMCEIMKRRQVGRDWCKLMWSLYELSNVRWLMLMSCIDCNDTQFFKCYVDKIKSYDCGMC